MYQRPLGSESLQLQRPGTVHRASGCLLLSMHMHCRRQRQADCTTARNGSAGFLRHSEDGHRRPRERQRVHATFRQREECSSRWRRQLPVGLLPSWGSLEAIPTAKVAKYPRQPPFHPSHPLYTKRPLQPAFHGSAASQSGRASQPDAAPRVPGSQGPEPCEDTPLHLPTPFLSKFLASQIGNRHRWTRKRHCPAHMLTPTLARPRKAYGLPLWPAGRLETQTQLTDPTWSPHL